MGNSKNPAMEEIKEQAETDAEVASQATTNQNQSMMANKGGSTQTRLAEALAKKNKLK